MKKISVLILSSLVLIPTFLWAPSAGATNSFQQFQQEVDNAYASYRMALFQTNKKNQKKAIESTLSFQQQWLAIIERYADAPPDVYAADSSWNSTLANIGDIAAQGIREILAGKLSDAHYTLEAIREELGALRQRNQVSIFSDHVNNYHEVMESLLDFTFKSTEIDNKSLLLTREKLALLDYLADKMQQNTPAEYIQNNDFQKAMQGIFGSLKFLRQAVDEKNADKITMAIQRLKPAYAKVFVNFG